MQHSGDNYNKINQHRIRREKWTKRDDNQLKKAIKDFGFDWLKIAQTFPNRNPNQCSQRWKKINRNNQKKQFWSEEEDIKLIQLIKQFGKRWKLIQANFNGRTSKQCRDRYLNKLDPNLKATKFTVPEDQIIYEQYLLLGPKWSKIVEFLPGRSQNQVKNRFYSFIRTDYLKVRNPYYSKLTQEEAKSELEQARKQHLLLIQNNQKPSSLFFDDDLLDLKSNCVNSPICLGCGVDPNSDMNFEF